MLMQRAFLLVLVLLALGCRQKIPMEASSVQLEDGIHISIRDAHAKNQRIHVVATVTNWSQHPVYIDRNYWGLRLPWGETLARVQGYTQKENIFTVDVGKARQITVVFHKPGLDVSTIATADLIVGGVTDHPSHPGHTVGEVHLSRAD